MPDSTIDNFWICDALFIQSDIIEKKYFDYDLLLAASILKSQNYVVKYIKNEKLASFSLEHRVKIIGKYNSKIIFINVCSDNFHYALSLSKKIKTYTKTPIVAIVSDDTNIDLSKNTFDYAITGSNEKSALDLYEYIVNNKGLVKDISGLVYKTSSQLITNNHSYIPDEVPSLTMSITYPINSTFYYSSRNYNGTILYKSAENVANDIIEIIKNFPVKHIYIADQNFMSDYNRFEKICEILANSNLDFKISCIADIFTLYKYPQISKILSKAHISLVEVSIQSAEQDILSTYDDNVTIKIIEKSIKNLISQKNVCVYGNITIGNPHETNESFEKTLNFCKKMTKMGKGFFFTKSSFLYKSKKFNINPDKYSLIINDESQLVGKNGEDVMYETATLKKEKLMELHYKFENEMSYLNINVLKKCCFEVIHFYSVLFRNYQIETFAKIILNNHLIKKYFMFSELKSVERLQNISDKELNEYLPIRLLPDTECKPSKTGYKLPFLNTYFYINDIYEISIYEYSYGKLNVGDIAKRICSELNYELGIDNFIKEKIIPFYKRLEKSYFIMLYR